MSSFYIQSGKHHRWSLVFAAESLFQCREDGSIDVLQFVECRDQLGDLLEDALACSRGYTARGVLRAAAGEVQLEMLRDLAHEHAEDPREDLLDLLCG